ncbi:SagB family peptide dehydrogenase [Halobacillus mangrovi]|uniref:NADH oxidase n=1 Tax=Halobacillus mangrovi TaxID=402384 RepID=A0A1W5ZSI3_9BACI|nr:SagB family peptide dehydrogenase [Halobacillus mangrovi]ARI76221.1 NADH oxidase [Halobacillus mangrovi]
MDLDTFLHHLHFHSERVIPPNWEVDWADAPLPYKIYRDLPSFPLAHDIPLSFQNQSFHSGDLDTISYYLWYVYGLSQFSQTALSSEMDHDSIETIQSFRRFPPSGGALYPNELYLYLKTEALPKGMYHYDVAHHSLSLLREGNFDSYLAKSLGDTSPMCDCFAVIIITTMFWKNFFKYNNFSYRLQGLDAGALMGQMLEVSKRFGFSTNVHFQFLDEAINHLLGLDGQEESTYAVIPLSDHEKVDVRDVAAVTASELVKELPKIKTTTYQRSEKVMDYPEISQINQHALIDSTRLFRSIQEGKKLKDYQNVTILPEAEKLEIDFPEVCRRRHSPELDFTSKIIHRNQLSSLLKETFDSFKYHNDLNQEKVYTPRLSIYGCFYNIEGMENGAYQYDEASHSLLRIKKGDYRIPLQGGMTLDNVNFHRVPMCFHIAGDRTFYKSKLGYRGYRILHMEAGMLLQRLLLTASALGMNGHPLLGFDVNVCDEIYELADSEQTTLLQVPIGFCNPKTWLIGAMHS